MEPITHEFWPWPVRALRDFLLLRTTSDGWLGHITTVRQALHVSDDDAVFDFAWQTLREHKIVIQEDTGYCRMVPWNAAIDDRIFRTIKEFKNEQRFEQRSRGGKKGCAVRWARQREREALERQAESAAQKRKSSSTSKSEKKTRKKTP